MLSIPNSGGGLPKLGAASGEMLSPLALPLTNCAPTDQTTWFGNAVNLAIAGGAWAVADIIARSPPPAWWRRGR